MELDINYDPNTKGYLDIIFGPIWDYIPLTRNYVENFLFVNLSNQEKISKIALGASELLENAVKYSNKDGIRLIIKKDHDDKNIILTVLNYSNKVSADELLASIEEMNKEDSLQYYLFKMKSSTTREDGKSCLGLARINHEAKATIAAEYDAEKEIVKVNATFAF